MLKYIIKRLLMMIPILLCVILIIFSILYITPGDPVEQLAGEEATAESKELLRKELGLDDPFFLRLGRYIYNIVFKGDFGTSYFTREPVMNMIAERFGATLFLATFSAIVSITLGVLLGTVAAVKQFSIFDNLSMFLALLGLSIPNFWQGLLLMLLFSLKLGWLPVSGFESFRHVILPALTIGTSCCAIIARMTRASVLEVIRQDYIVTARAKGQKESKVILFHAMKNAMIPILTSIGLQFGALLGGSILTETVFNIPGLGLLMINSVKRRDYPMVQGAVLYSAIIFSIVNLLVDILYAVVDPRIRTRIAAKGKEKQHA